MGQSFHRWGLSGFLHCYQRLFLAMLQTQDSQHLKTLYWLQEPFFVYSVCSVKSHFKWYFAESGCLSYWEHHKPEPPGIKQQPSLVPAAGYQVLRQEWYWGQHPSRVSAYGQSPKETKEVSHLPSWPCAS